MLAPLLAVAVCASIALGGCGSTTTGSSSGFSGSSSNGGSDDSPPAISRADYKRLKLGTTRATVFARFGRSDYAEGPSPATGNVNAKRCYTYAVAGVPFKVFESASWWLCFTGTVPGSKLVHKEKK